LGRRGFRLGRLAFYRRRVAPHFSARLTGARARAEHLHAVAHDLGGVAVLAFLVLPLARAQAALDVDLRALLQIFAGDLGQLAAEDDAVPLGLLLLLAARLVIPLERRRHRNVGDRRAVGHIACLGIAPEVADQDDLVHRCHSNLPSNQFTHSILVPLSWHYLQPRNALGDHHFGLAHTAHTRQGFAQS